jgi:anti-anti-sigma factor
MEIDRSKQHNSRTKPRSRPASPKADREPERTLIAAERCEEWIPVEELKKEALRAAGKGRDVTVDLGRIDHLDASALQVLLALESEQKRQGRTLELSSTSPLLRRWFEYAGAEDLLSTNDWTSNE